MQLVGIQIYNLNIARIKKQYKEMKYKSTLFLHFTESFLQNLIFPFFHTNGSLGGGGLQFAKDSSNSKTFLSSTDSNITWKSKVEYSYFDLFSSLALFRFKFSLPPER